MQSAPKYLHIYTFLAIPDQQLTQQNLRKLLLVFWWALAKSALAWVPSAEADTCAPMIQGGSRASGCHCRPTETCLLGACFCLYECFIWMFLLFSPAKLKFRHRLLVAVVMGAAITFNTSSQTRMRQQLCKTITL